VHTGATRTRCTESHSSFPPPKISCREVAARGAPSHVGGLGPADAFSGLLALSATPKSAMRHHRRRSQRRIWGRGELAPTRLQPPTGRVRTEFNRRLARQRPLGGRGCHRGCIYVRRGRVGRPVRRHWTPISVRSIGRRRDAPYPEIGKATGELDPEQLVARQFKEVTGCSKTELPAQCVFSDGLV
jgi:hypothetical protein